MTSPLGMQLKSMFEGDGPLAHLKNAPSIMPSLDYYRMEIDYGWILRKTRTFTKEMSTPFAKYLENKRDYDPQKYVHYIMDQDLVHFPRWKNVQISRPTLLSKLLRHKNILFTQWHNFAPRHPRKVNSEQHICVVKGKEVFRIVSPIFRKNIYVGEWFRL